MQSFFSAKKPDPAPADGGAVLSPPPAIRYSPVLNCNAAAAAAAGLIFCPVIGRYMTSNLYPVAACASSSQQYDCKPVRVQAALSRHSKCVWMVVYRLQMVVYRLQMADQHGCVVDVYRLQMADSA